MPDVSKIKINRHILFCATVSSEKALKIFSDRPYDFDLVITDQTMPEMTGIELVKKLKAIRNDIPVILCTGHSDYINEENFSSMGITKFIMKPYSSKILAEAILAVSSEYPLKRN